MAKQVHIVPHMHWDREWYFTAEESQILLINNMEEIFERLENDPTYPTYTLDGQTAVLEDYLTFMPQNKDRLKKLVQQGRLIIGPWYTQTDEMVVGGESIVRNLLYGHKDSKEYGEIMKIGYLPDSFGQSAQLPMILNGFDIHRSMFWRGTSERMGTNKTEFYWQSDDGSKVLTQLLPLGYAIGKYLPTDFEGLKKRCEKYMPVLDRGASKEHILIPNGHDQMPIQKNITEVIEQLHNIYPEKSFFLSSYDNLFKELEKYDDYDTIQGECLDGKYMRVHRSIFSSRSDIKAMNTQLENKLTNILEPLASIAYSFGFDYQHGFIESIWKEMMKNHAHDSIGCCCSDEVHQEIMDRFTIANEKVDRLITFYKRKITDAMSCDIALDKLSIFNLLPYKRSQVIEAEITTRIKSFKLVDEDQHDVEFKIVKSETVDAGLIDRQIVHYGNYDPFVRYTIQFEKEVPAMGFTTLFLIEHDSSMDIDVVTVDALENKFYKIECLENGTLQIFDKNTNKIYKDVLLLEDGADDGDGYDFSELEDDFIITSKDVKANITLKKEGFNNTATISYDLALPSDLDARKNKVVDGSISVTFRIDLMQDSRFIKIESKIDNRVKDHRLRVLIPSMCQGSHSVSDNQFGMITRPVYDTAMDVWEKENWSERPDSIYPMLSYVAIKDSHIAAFTNSIREYEIINENYDTLALTLYRCVGYLGKENLYRRPGRPSGIKMPTPDSQMMKEMTFDFALCTYDKEATLAKLAKEYVTPIVTYNKMPYNAMKLNDSNICTPYSHSFFTQENDDIVLSVLKKAEYQDALLVRFFTTNEKSQQAKLNVPFIQTVNLNEEMIDDCIDIKCNQVKSYLIAKK